MLMEVKKEFKVFSKSFKYAVMREMLNKTTFITNIVFMILNNASFIVQWIILYSLKSNIGGYSLNEILLLWGLSASTYGVAHLFFENAFNLSDIINNGALDSYIVQPKNILLSSITSEIKVSAIGDIIYGYIILFIYGITLKNFILFTIFTLTGGLIMVSIIIILNSLSFWINNASLIADTEERLLVQFATYPDGIFKGITKILLYSIVPVGIISYIPINLIINFDYKLLLLEIIITIILILLANIIFNNGLKRYSSSNLLNVRI